MNTKTQDFTQSFDARDWATAFVQTVREQPGIPLDEGTMVGWFANAIMRGYDEHARRYPGSESEKIDAALIASRSTLQTSPTEPHNQDG